MTCIYKDSNVSNLMRKVIEKLKIQHPIIQAPMAGDITTPKLIAAVSNAGGLGSLGAGYMDPIQIKKAIQDIRALTTKPFAVNLFIPEEHHATMEELQIAWDNIQQCSHEIPQEKPVFSEKYLPSFKDQLKVIMEEKVPVLSFTFGILEPKWVKMAKSNNIVLMGTATNLLEAKMLQNQGIDIIVAQGCEAGGHRGTFSCAAEEALASRDDLLKQLLTDIKVPIIATGGIMNGKDIIDVLTIGAAGAQLGTAFLSCSESGAHEEYKKALLSQHQDNTVLTRVFSGKLARGIKNKFITCMEANHSLILNYPIQNTLTKPLRNKAKELGLSQFMSMFAGQNAKACRAVSAKVLMDALLDEMRIEGAFESIKNKKEGDS